MTRASFRPWLSLLAYAAVEGVAYCLHARRPAPPPTSVLISPPDPAFPARLEAKRRVTAEVISGRMTLLEAAEAFEAIDDDGGLVRADVLTSVLAPGGSEEEAYCRMVIIWVRAETPSGRADARARALEAELATRLKDGTLRPPD